MKAIGLCRVSTQEQGEEGVSLDAQESKIRAYCLLYDIELAAVFHDVGSGKDMDRDGLQEALRMLSAGEADGIVVVKLDRLTRSVKDFQYLLENYFCGPSGFRLCSIGDSIDTQTAIGRLLLNITMSINQWVREEICEKTRDALRHKKSKGERTGNVPYGKDLSEDGITLIDNPYEQSWLAQMRAWRIEGKGYTTIATRLTNAGVPTKRNGQIVKKTGRIIGNKWSPGVVQKLAP